MGSKHYHKAVDCWAVGFIEVLGKPDGKRRISNSFHSPIHLFDAAEREWPGMKNTPEYHNVKRLDE